MVVHDRLASRMGCQLSRRVFLEIVFPASHGCEYVNFAITIAATLCFYTIDHGIFSAAQERIRCKLSSQ